MEEEDLVNRVKRLEKKLKTVEKNQADHMTMHLNSITEIHRLDYALRQQSCCAIL